MSALAVASRPTDGDTDDRDLVAGVRAGDDRAFELLFQRYQPRITAYVRGMVHDDGRAEDITQEVFISALRRMREERSREILFKPWIFEIAKNKCIDAFRRTRNASEVSFDAHDAIGADEHGRLAGPGPTPDSAVEGKLAIDNLCRAFGGLSPVHHDILVLRELQDLSYREIGDRLDMSRRAVESTLFRARKRLSEEYEELISGERCLDVQRTADASGGRSAGLRDRRRMARHLSHCQPCRRYAARAGVDLQTLSRPAAAAARIAAFLPLPAFLRRRGHSDEALPLLGHGGPVSQWSSNVVAVVDPGLISSWTKAVATAATVAIAGMGAGAALDDRGPAGVVTPGSPFAQAPAAGLFSVGGDPAAARTAPAAKGGAVRGRLSAGDPALAAADRSQPAGGAPAPTGTPSRSGATAPQGPAGSHSSAPPAPAGAGATVTDGRAVAPGAGTAATQVLETVAAVESASEAVGSGAAVPDGSGPLHNASALAPDALSLDPAARSTLGSTLTGTPVEPVASARLSSTLSEPRPSTTTVLGNLGG